MDFKITNMLSDYYEFYNPVKVVAGKNAIKNIKLELDILDKAFC
ncbi:MAG: hypothetical protein U9R54_10050 [Bacteroidota bacterium]|nr:hypothetical protein [Bacteroidota bacterium]